MQIQILNLDADNYHTYILKMWKITIIMSDMDSHLSPALQAGTPAPNFTLHSTPDQSVSLSQFRGNPTILAFYPADFSPVCGAI